MQLTIARFKIFRGKRNLWICRFEIRGCIILHLILLSHLWLYSVVNFELLATMCNLHRSFYLSHPIWLDLMRRRSFIQRLARHQYTRLLTIVLCPVVFNTWTQNETFPILHAGFFSRVGVIQFFGEIPLKRISRLKEFNFNETRTKPLLWPYLAHLCT
jgi:hypothetical protein